MCVVNKHFELFEFVLIPFMLTCSMMRFLSILLLGLCPCVVSVVVLPYVDAVVAVTVMPVLLFVLYVCLLRGCDVYGNAGVGDG